MSTSTLNVNIGVLGHVDSGKTSLVRVLSTMFSTASLDKSPMSRQRGMTLDLGFSGATLDVPENVEADHPGRYDALQLTFVDCPGHASLIKTVIGGAHIIDMMILVVNVVKGFQAQTAECLVIGEITTDKMIVVLNKVDLIPPASRKERISSETKKIRKILEDSRFKSAQIVAVSAHVGGGGKSGGGSDFNVARADVKTIGIDSLISTVTSMVSIPDRAAISKSGSLFLSVDHCFPIRGQGTVLTGTIVRGSVRVGDVVEITSHLKIKKKVKSIQMFRKPVQSAQVGDRVGICVAGLDAKSIERGIVAAPDTVPRISGALCLVRRVRFFRKRHACLSGGTFHVTVGHTTTMATVTFFGAAELKNEIDRAGRTESPWFLDRIPKREFDWDREYEYQSEMIGSSRRSEDMDESSFDRKDVRGVVGGDVGVMGREPLQWALLRFDKPTQCRLDSIVIGSRLDLKDEDMKTCRLAFFGCLTCPVHVEDSEALAKIRIFKGRTKMGSISKVDKHHPGQVIVDGLFSAAVPRKRVLGLKLFNKSGDIGIVRELFGGTGKLKVQFEPDAAKRLRLKQSVVLKMRKYVFAHDRKGLTQAWLDAEDCSPLNEEDIVALSLKDAAAVATKKKKKKKPTSETSNSNRDGSRRKIAAGNKDGELNPSQGRGRGRGVAVDAKYLPPPMLGRGRGRGRGRGATVPSLHAFAAPGVGRGRGRGRGLGGLQSASLLTKGNGRGRGRST